ncbi:MAG: ATP-binding cassette domain-containing protein [Bacteroidetes bacterium]|nr:MAG: ATP-binding cassette domain-containing protein [Bacteroidota bacterium]
MTEPFLRIESVTKVYDQYVAVDHVSLSIPGGQIFGLLGPNGAGKTSIIRMITGITAPDSGQIFFQGQPLSPEHVRYIGYMPEERGLYKKMKIREQLEYFLQLKGIETRAARATATSWLERLGLGEWQNKNAADLSKGMQQKVQFIATVAHEPKLLILDEPFTGLDPVNARLIEEEIMRLRDNGATIIFSTHRLEQVEEFCNHIALMNKGKLLLHDEVATVRKQFNKNQYRIEFLGDKQVVSDLPGIMVDELGEKEALVRVAEGSSGRQLMHQLADSPLEIFAFEQHLPRLTDIFIELVGSQSPEAEAMRLQMAQGSAA